MHKMSLPKESKGPSMNRFNAICVFGESNLGKDRAFLYAALDLGNELATRKINLVYGGGVKGLKGCLAGSVIVKGGQVLSVVSKDESTSSFNSGHELRVQTLQERMGNMMHNADAFIALPGGIDTLEEISCIIFSASRNCHRKPLGLLNVNGFYDGFLSFLDHAVKQEFISQAMRSNIVSASTAVELLEKLQNPSSELFQVKAPMDKSDEGGRKKAKSDTTLHL